jgi:hypothetical protein
MPDRLTRRNEPGDDPAQLTFDFPAKRRSSPPQQRPSPVDDSALPLPRYLTRREAAAYIRCSLRFLDGMGLPFICKGRCKLYDRVDLDQRMQQD